MNRIGLCALLCCVEVAVSSCGVTDSTNTVTSLRKYGAPEKPFVEISYDGLDGTNLRAGPSVDSARVGEALFRQRFELLSIKTTSAPVPLDRWLQIRMHNGQEAWIAASLTNYSAAILSQVQVKSSDGYPIVLRHGPGTYYVPETEIASGTTVTVLGERTDERRAPLNRWLQVRTSSGRVGWVASFLTNYPSPRTAPPKRVSSGAAFLSVIAYAEGTNDRYDYCFTFKTFSSFHGHPRIRYRGAGVVSDAAGRYQFLSPTWDEVHPVLRLVDFSPGAQDAAALYMLRKKGIAPNGIRTYEQFQSAVYRVRNIWSSLPGSENNQPIPYTLDHLWSKFQEFVSSP